MELMSTFKIFSLVWFIITALVGMFLTCYIIASELKYKKVLNIRDNLLMMFITTTVSIVAWLGVVICFLALWIAGLAKTHVGLWLAVTIMILSPTIVCFYIGYLRAFLFAAFNGPMYVPRYVREALLYLKEPNALMINIVLIVAGVIEIIL